MLKLARTIGDRTDAEQISPPHLAEAILLHAQVGSEW
jgi:hypothetical protein